MSVSSRIGPAPTVESFPTVLDRLEHVIRDRRSVRRYARRPVDRELVLRLCDAARWAPSNWNGQPWRFIVIDDGAAIARICALLEERAAVVAREATDGDVRLARFIEHCRRYFLPLHECAVLIAACYKPAGRLIEAAVAEHFGDAAGMAAWNPNLLSLGMAVQNLLLAAHAAGLAGCFHSGPVVFLRGGLHDLLGLPPRLELAGVVTLGWPVPDAEARTVTRRPLERFVQFPDGKGS